MRSLRALYHVISTTGLELLGYKLNYMSVAPKFIAMCVTRQLALLVYTIYENVYINYVQDQHNPADNVIIGKVLSNFQLLRNLD